MAVASLFDMLRYLGPSIVAFEDLDFIGASRDIHVSSNNGQLGDLLTNLDGMRKHKEPLVIIASTNKIEMLDSALSARPGRFDRRIAFELPDNENLKKIYHKLTGLYVNDEVIKLSKDFTGSHAVEAVNTARILATSEDKKLEDCMKEACIIIKENFFPGQTAIELQSNLQKVLTKKGFKVQFQKKASKSW
jgi:cell division protease FtsH